MSDKIDKHRQMSLGVVSQREINGIEMGVLEDGTAFMTGRGLAKLCNVAPGIILGWAPSWTPSSGSRRDQVVRNALEEQGYSESSLFRRVDVGGNTVLAFPEQVCMAVLEYYAFSAKQTESREKALSNYRRLARAGFRTFVYSALGYSPIVSIPEPWRKFHDRVSINQAPFGYFSVFSEMAGIIVTAIRRGLQVDEHTVPDISMGMAWGKHWVEKGFDSEFGQRVKSPHNYPDYFPQSGASVDAWVYPVDSLGEFRRWMQRHYLPKKFPKYLTSKARSGALPVSVVELLVSEINDELKALGAASNGDDD